MESKVWKAGVYAFTQNGIKFYCAGFDLGEAAHFMEPGEWVLISPQRDVKWFCAQGQESDVKQAFIDHGRNIEKVYQVIDNKIQWPPIAGSKNPWAWNVNIYFGIGRYRGLRTRTNKTPSSVRPLPGVNHHIKKGT